MVIGHDDYYSTLEIPNLILDALETNWTGKFSSNFLFKKHKQK